MRVSDAKSRTAEWIETIRVDYPELVAAHLVGGITALSDDTEFPPTKDVDVHLILPDGNPALDSAGPIANILEVEFQGVLIEAGFKPASDYQNAETVLANPEIAQHLVNLRVLFDPNGMLAGLQPAVAGQFTDRQWVKARVDHERRAGGEITGMIPMARQFGGPAVALNLLGYSVTFLTAAVQLAALRPLRMGGRTTVNLREVLAEYDQLELYEDTLQMLGVQAVDRSTVEHYLTEAERIFDLAVAIQKTRFPFDHKLRPHLRPYFVNSCRQMIEEGFHREALAWIEPFVICGTEIIKADGNPEQRVEFAEIQDSFLAAVGFGTDAEVDERIALGADIRARIFALTDQIIATNPAITN